MFYTLYTHFGQDSALLNLFKYLSFRSAGALLTAFLIAFLWGPSFIGWLKKKQKEGQPIRSDGPESHLLTKKGTPTMGGGLILCALFTSTLLWADIQDTYVWVVLMVTFGFGLLGGYDDYLKLTKRSSSGLSGKKKLLFQTLISLVAVSIIIGASEPSMATVLTFPFFKKFMLDLGLFYGAFGVLVIIGASNAVNLTDGLDGLATGPVMLTAACFALIAYLVGNQVFANYLQIHYVAGTGELAVFCGALIGAGLGFLWFNAPPAMVFMGDTGSLAIGGALGTIAVATKHEIVLAIVGGIFVLEAVSVILQVLYFKLSGGKRIFLMAPIHHHFEKKGWAESTVVFRFWIISVILALVGLSTLKLR